LIAFADNLVVLSRGAYKMETENYPNQDLKKIEGWATDNKLEFNDKKFKVLFLTSKRNDNMEVNIYLNYKRLDQTEKIEIFRNILRKQI